MCTFCSDLPTNEYGANRKKAPITLFLKPNDPNNESEKYRFRILNFRSPVKNDRAYPFISRYVHNHWGINENGFKVVDDYVVCPATPYIDAKNDPSLGFADTYHELKLKDKKATWDNVCPVCRRVAEAWNSWKSSGKTDRLAVERAGNLKRQFQGIVPVYVINDPINEKNNGRFKCIIFSNQSEYKQFIDIVNAEVAKIVAGGRTYDWCNGKNAVDFYLRMDKVPVIWNEGKSNEKQGTVRKITRMAFGTKPYDLVDVNGHEIVTKEAIDKFEFDDQYYVKSTKTELEDFYKKYFSLVASSIPSEDEDVFGDSTPTPRRESTVRIPQNPNISISAGSSTELMNDLISDPDDIPPPVEDDDDEKMEASPRSVEELLSQLDFKD